jgi:hypothetical protein
MLAKPQIIALFSLMAIAGTVEFSVAQENTLIDSAPEPINKLIPLTLKNPNDPAHAIAEYFDPSKVTAVTARPTEVFKLEVKPPGIKRGPMYVVAYLGINLAPIEIFTSATQLDAAIKTFLDNTIKMGDKFVWLKQANSAATPTLLRGLTIAVKASAVTGIVRTPPIIDGEKPTACWVFVGGTTFAIAPIESDCGKLAEKINDYRK